MGSRRAAPPATLTVLELGRPGRAAIELSKR